MSPRAVLALPLLLAVAFGIGIGIAPESLHSQEIKLGTEINSLPYTIGVPGVYILKQDFTSLNLASGAAITVNVSDVVIEFNGHTISNAAAGAGSSAFGVYAADKTNVTVRNGTLQGFLAGVNLNATGSGSLSSGHLLEKLRLRANRCWGIYLQGSASSVVACRVEQTGGSTLSGYALPTAISVSGTGDRVLDCDVSDVTASGTSILFASATDAFAIGNRLGGPAAHGIYYTSAATGKFRKNIAETDIRQAYLGGTNAGNNLIDSNSNGVDDDWETRYGLALNNPSALGQSAAGGLTYLQKYQLGLDPLVASTAGDAFTDGWKVAHNLDAHRRMVADNSSGALVSLRVFTPLN